MSKPEMLNEEPITMAELKTELQKIKKRDNELSFRGNKTEEYLNIFVKQSKKKSKELYDAIEALSVPRLKPIHITKLVDIAPDSAEEVKTVLQGYTLTVSQENCKKIAKCFG